MIRVFPTLREPTLPEFLATDQHAARWLPAMRAPFVRGPPPAARRRGPLSPPRAPAEGGAAYHAVVQWMPPVHDGRERMRFTSPLAVAYTAHCRALLRYGAVEAAAALRLTAPVMFARPAGSDAASPITASPAAVLDPARDAAGGWGARAERGTYAPYHPGAAPAVLHRLHRGASYANIVNHLLRPGRLLPPFDASHAEGIASAATAVLRLLGHRAVVRADRQFLAPAAKRANVDDDPDDTSSDDNED